MPKVSWGKEVEQLLLTSEEHFKTRVGLGRREASLATAKGRQTVPGPELCGSKRKLSHAEKEDKTKMSREGFKMAFLSV